MISPAPILNITDMTKDFPGPEGRVTVLRNINLTVNEGEFVMITGPSGSGKSTILNLVAMLDKPTSGSIQFRGRDISGLDDDSLCEIRKRDVGMVFQKFCLLPYRSVMDNVLFRFRYINGIPVDAVDQARTILNEMGLGGITNRPARLLSSGEMQRTAIARAVILRPLLLVADEPTGNLDGVSTDIVMSCFQKLNKNGLTIIMVTHNQSLLKFSSRHKICRDGVLE